MATKPNSKPKAPKAPAAKAAPATPAKGRGAVYQPTAAIAVVSGEGARRVVRSLACDRALTAMRAHPTVGAYVAAFGAECDKRPLPGRAGQPGATQAAAILRYLEREGAVTVR